MKSLILASTLICASVASAAPAPAVAQGTCGWDELVAPDHLPKFVETVFAQVPSSWGDASKTRDNLRKWYHNCDVTAGHQAMFDLQRVAERNKNDMAVIVLYGLALVHGPEVQMEGGTGVTNRAMYHLSNSERDGARLLARASADPRFADAAIDLAQMAIGTRHDATIKIARNALKAVTDKQPLPEYLRYEAELALTDKDYAYAIAQGERADAAGDKAALHAVGIAQLFTATDSVSAVNYLAGMSDPHAIDLYYDDLSYLLEPADTLAWSQVAQTERGDWIRSQWKWRASTSSLSLAERLKLHFTRLLYAWKNYPRTAFRTPPLNNAIVYDNHIRHMSVDDRGLIYIRHGPPAEIIHMATSAIDNTRMAWGYNGLADGRAIFEFTKVDCGIAPVVPSGPMETSSGARVPKGTHRTLANSGSAGVGQSVPSYASTAKCSNSGDYYLATPLPCVEYGTNVEQATYQDYGIAVARFDPAFASMMVDCYDALAAGDGDGVKFLELVYLSIRRHALNEGTIALRTETASPNLTDPIGTVFHTYAMRDGGVTQLYAFAAINGSDIHPKAGTSEYALRLLLAVEHNAKLSTEGVDTTLRFKTAAPMTAGQMARTRLATIATPSANATIRFTVRNENDRTQGQILTTMRPIPDFTGTGLALSDLVVAATTDGSWQRGDIKLSPIPGHYVMQGSTFRLFYELYGAQGGDPLNIQVTIAPSTDPDVLSKIKELISRKSGVQVGFTDRASVDATGTARVSRDITADLQPGRYEAAVIVTDTRNSATATSHTNIIVVKQ